MKNTVNSLFIAILFLTLSLQVSASKRVALIIGNADYSIANGRLANPVNDAKSLTIALKDLGFKVLYRANLTTREEMEIAVEDFSGQINEADIALFYYSGHGVQQQDNNYLMPTQAVIKNARQIRHRAMNVSFLIDEMKASTQGLSLVILDACRDNPYIRSSRSSATRGLARMKTPNETMIAYATEPGATAADGIGRHSPYAAQLLKHLKSDAHRPIFEVMNKVHVAVVNDTNNQQSPRLDISPLRNVYCFSECSSSQIATAQVSTETKPFVPVPIDNSQVEISFWNSIKDSHNAEYYSAYISKFGDNAIYAPIAKIKLQDLSKIAQSATLPDREQTRQAQRIATYLEKGRIFLYDEGRPEKALDYFNKALILDRRNATIYYELGAASIELFEYPEAIHQLKQAIKYDPNNLAAYKKLAFSYTALGDDAKAAYYKQYYQ